jgi:tRNA-specific 2-thiouridylase
VNSIVDDQPQFDAAVAMSGGVDSSVAAALLVEQGLRVIGVTLKLWHARMDGCDDNLCCSADSVESARRTCRRLGIDHIVLNAEREFRERVVDDFIDAYSRGLTPNPCVVCNPTIKFGELHRRLAALGIHKVATGHYARIERDPCTGRFLLMRPMDHVKDQTYMLYRLSQSQLESTLFPLGNLTKQAVRETARRLGLESAERRDSQEVCFTPKGRYREFLLSERPALGEPGPILDLLGRVIGEHRGIAMYTVGQRRALGRLADRGGAQGSNEAMYVIQIRPTENAIVVGPRSSAYSRRLTASDLNWIAFEQPPEIMRADVKIRYTSPAAAATVSNVGAATAAGAATALTAVAPTGAGLTASVLFDEEQLAVSPGQSAVFYDGDTVLGGGIIQSSMTE